jgi:hypothetical protein
MQLGELFFSLGFKNTGIADAKNFENSINASHEASVVLNNTFINMTELLETMAVKMGAVTLEEIHQKKAANELLDTKNKTALADTNHNIAGTKKIGILQTLTTKTGNYLKAMMSTKVQVTAATSALVYFTKKAADAAIQIDKIASSSGLSPETVQRLSEMAKTTGGDINDITSALRHLQTEATNIALGRGGNIGVFQYLGVDPQGDPMKVLDQLMRKLNSMPVALRNTMAAELGFTDDLMYMWRNMGNVAPARPETLLTDKELKRLKDFGFYFNKIWEQSKRVLEKFGAVLTPIATSILRMFDSLGTSFSIVMNKMGPFFDMLKKHAPALIIIAGALLVAFAPLTASLIVLAAVFEDLMGFMAGKDSLFGRMIDYLTDANGMLKDMIHWYIQLRKAMTLGNYDKYWDEQEKKMLEGSEQFLERKKKEAEGTTPESEMEKTLPGMKEKFDNTNLENMNKKFKGMLEGLLNIYTPKTPEMGTNLKSRLSGAEQSSTATTNNNNVTININESNTPRDTANEVQNVLSDTFFQMRSAEA